MRAVEPSYSPVGVAAVHSRYAYLSIITAIDYQISDFWILWPSLFFFFKAKNCSSEFFEFCSITSINHSGTRLSFVRQLLLSSRTALCGLCGFFFPFFLSFFFSSLCWTCYLNFSSWYSDPALGTPRLTLCCLCVCVLLCIVGVKCSKRSCISCWQAALTVWAACCSCRCCCSFWTQVLCCPAAYLPACLLASLCLSCSFLYNMCFTNVP